MVYLRHQLKLRTGIVQRPYDKLLVIVFLVIVVIALYLVWDLIPAMSYYGSGLFVKTGRGILAIANEWLAEPLTGSFSDATFWQWLKGCVVVGLMGATVWGVLYWVLRRTAAKEMAWATAFWAGIAGLIWGLASWAQISGKLETLSFLAFLVPFGMACYYLVRGVRLLGSKEFLNKATLLGVYLVFFLLSMLLAAVVGILIAMIAITIYIILGVIMGGGHRCVHKQSRARPSHQYEPQTGVLDDGTPVVQDYAGSDTWHNRDYSEERYERVGENEFKQIP